LVVSNLNTGAMTSKAQCYVKSNLHSSNVICRDKPVAKPMVFQED